MIYGLLTKAGDAQSALAVLRGHVSSYGEWESIYEQARANRVALPSESGAAYRFSQEKMAVTTLTNLVYPIYTQGRYTRQYSPGRWWDCLYTWDSGFVGIGLNTVEPEHAIQCLLNYITPVDDDHHAFIHHGSMVPTQIYLFMEIWNRTQDVALLRRCYPLLRRYYLFYAGQAEGSTTGAMKSGLLKTWDYFYNSGGWDDYPPQVEIHRRRLEAIATPCANTAHAIRFARALSYMARALGGLGSDIEQYEADATRMMRALDDIAYDADSGYYSYVLHDEQGKPASWLRHESGQNYNMGLDGAEPLMTGMVELGRAERIVSLMMAPDHMWTAIGLSTVDQSAAYYTPDGYWNGAVWMPHQWFVYKALLDMDKEADEAFRIASAALELWKNEVDESYNCFEHFIVATKRGAGWHQFSALSTPVLYWYCAYYMHGRFTCGMDVWIDQVEFTDDSKHMTAKLKLNGPRDSQTRVIAGMAEGHDYAAMWNGKPIALTRRTGAAWEASLPNADRGGVLEIMTKK